MSTRSLVAFCFGLSLAVGTMGCGSKSSLSKLAGPITSSSSSKKKDCDACKKMCKVGGDAEKNEKGVEACIKDCEKSCE